jgi:hypothetical protein
LPPSGTLATYCENSSVHHENVKKTKKQAKTHKQNAVKSERGDEGFVLDPG